MGKQTYILLTILIFVQFFGLKIFSPIFVPQIKIFVLIIWAIYGFLLREKEPTDYVFYKEKRYWSLIMTGFIMTFVFVMILTDPYPNINSYLNYLIILTYYLSIPVLLLLRPDKEEIINACLIFSFLYAIFFIVHIIEPMWFEGAIDEITGRVKEIDEGDFGYIMDGYSILLIPLYNYLSKVSNGSAEKKEIILIVLLAIMVFLNQNRSTIFPMILVAALALWSTPNLWLRLFLITIVIIFAVNPALNPLYKLLDETTVQTSDASYARIMSWTVLPLYSCDTWLHTFLGHGYGPNSIAQFEAMKESFYIDSSDVGFIGFWSRCGLLPLVIMSIMLISTLIKRYYPTDVKYLALTIIICSATISYFLLPSHIMWFTLFFLLWSTSRREYVTLEDEEADWDDIELP